MKMSSNLGVCLFRVKTMYLLWQLELLNYFFQTKVLRRSVADIAVTKPRAIERIIELKCLFTDLINCQIFTRKRIL